jgi:cell division protein FtsI/penicillin-binding protein 2
MRLHRLLCRRPVVALALLAFGVPSIGAGSEDRLAKRGRTPAVDRAADKTEPARDLELRRIVWRDGTARAPSKSGWVELTMSANLQRAAERLLARAAPKLGGIVVADVRTGEVLVWAEHAPQERPGTVLLDTRAAAASVFKLVTAAALLESGSVAPADVVCHSGGRHGIERQHLEAPKQGAFCGPFGDALGHSRNAVFAQLTTRHLARQDLIDIGARLGFNGAVPFEAHVMTGTLDVPYSDLDVARTAAGFRGNSLSVLGGAHLAMTIASGGQVTPLRITRAPDELEGQARLPVRALETRTAHRLTRMMEVTVHSGTSREAFTAPGGKSHLGGIRVAGKTGTLHPGDPRQTTSWFVGFAPSRRPEIVVSVLLQNGAVWRQKANQVARDLLRTYFAGRGTPPVTDPFAEEIVAATP